ncbi:MAG: general secretion pathway protein D [Verrucomicrobiales bacterium]|jgi:general secretion pathway protein D
MWIAVPAAIAVLFVCTANSLRAQDVGEVPLDDGVSLQFPNNPVSDILGIYELLTGKTLVKDIDIFDLDEISLITAHPVSRERAISLIESSLLSNGYILIDDATNNSVRVLPPTAPQARVTQSMPVYRSPEELPNNKMVAMYFMELKHMDPMEAGTVMANHVGLNTFGRITPVQNPRGLIITESADTIRQLINFKEVIDRAEVKDQRNTHYVDLKHAESTIVAQIIQATFTSRPSKAAIVEETIMEGRDSDAERFRPAPPPQVVADDRLNRLMIVANDADYSDILAMIERFDQPTKLPETLERPLKYVFVDEVLPVIAEVLQDSGVGTSALPGGGSVTVRQQPRASTPASTLTGTVRRGVQVRENAGTVPGGGGRQDQLISPLENTAPVSVKIGKTQIIADLMANKLIAMGPRESLDKIDDLLDRLDRKPPQAYLATVIGQLTLTDGIEVGVDYFRQFKQEHDGGVAGSFVVSEGLLSQASNVATGVLGGAASAQSGLNLYGQIRDDLDVFIRALESTSKFEVLDRPVVSVQNNKKAMITSGRRIPVPTSSVTDFEGDGTNVRTNIDFQDVVLKLEVIPLINSDNEVSLTIAQVNDTVVGEQRVADNVVPIIGTEQITTSVTVPNRTTIVLGGLITENEQLITDGIPLVSRLPLIGNAFKHTRKEKTRKELVIFIQPIVVTDDMELANASLVEDMRTGVGATANESFPDVDPQAVADDPYGYNFPVRKRTLWDKLFEPNHKKTKPQIPR